MQAGKLREPIALYSPGVTRDAIGQEVVAWVFVANVWAQIIPLNAREFFTAAAIQQEHTVHMRLRARSDILVSWRIVWGEMDYDVTGVQPIPGGEYVDVYAKHGTRDGV